MKKAEGDRVWKHWKDQMVADQRATEAMERYEKRDAYLTDYCAINGYSEKATRDKKDADWVLVDAEAVWKRWCAEAQRHFNAIQTEYAARAILGIPMNGEDPGNAKRPQHRIPSQSKSSENWPRANEQSDPTFLDRPSSGS